MESRPAPLPPSRCFQLKGRGRGFPESKLAPGRIPRPDRFVDFNSDIGAPFPRTLPAALLFHPADSCLHPSPSPPAPTASSFFSFYLARLDDSRRTGATAPGIDDFTEGRL